MKTFGNAQPQKTEPVPFTLRFARGNDIEEQVFQAKPRIDAGDLGLVAHANSGDLDRSAGAILRLIEKMLDNTDGTPTGWEPTLLPQHTDSSPARVLYDEDGNPVTLPGDTPADTSHEPAYRGPDGAIHLMADTDTLNKFRAIQNGSSRRRWRYLMNDDDDAYVGIGDLTDIVKFLISEATDRPTEPSNSS